ncbi:hypothetical protein B0H67DRAFT_209563 [Lasiosphaeris hirsuta]|uniref:Secreted protein n=1 Tax=Lasiosphaeris hirsuta TaxID=260670 RepID=A0AA40AS44_9PEZI|nr:hypothetical protein B0H67DRAFT_209563 [Lasiosphaeris hirsuta]
MRSVLAMLVMLVIGCIWLDGCHHRGSTAPAVLLGRAAREPPARRVCVCSAQLFDGANVGEKSNRKTRIPCFCTAMRVRLRHANPGWHLACACLACSCRILQPVPACVPASYLRA